jgi:D-beta-D-heptose 7-phosphate kinase/D-beta-D-heptose 1-phosphate adenosyltransferase
MLDRFVYGDVERISPEAPIPILKISREVTMLGGAGNVVRNLVALGVTPYFLSLIGDDSEGREVMRLINLHDEINSKLIIECGHKTIVKTRFSAGSQQLLRVDLETQAVLTKHSHKSLLNNALKLIPKVNAIVLSDYDKGMLDKEIIRQLIKEARTIDKPVIVDPKGNDYSIYSGAYLITPNRKELYEATGLSVNSDTEIVKAARLIMNEYSISNILVTRSYDGMTLITESDDIYHLPTNAHEVFDVSGAGDTVVSVMTVSIASGITLPIAIKLANVAAGIVVGKIGTAVAYTSDIITSLYNSEVTAIKMKVVDRIMAIDQVSRWKCAGQKVGFTNGCFDLLHPGHFSLLHQSRAQCDHLVVGLNSDRSVKQLKGENRPIQSEMIRANVVASIPFVDLVIIFDENTPYNLIVDLHPDILIKGGDYKKDQIIGADLVQKWGGKIILAELMAGYSTTTIISSMKQ